MSANLRVLGKTQEETVFRGSYVMTAQVIDILLP